MTIITLIAGDTKRICFKERLGCGDADMICVVRDDGRTIKIPKSNIAYIEE